MRDHYYNLETFRSARSAIFEFRKRVSWYAKQMNPCRLLRDEMRTIESAADFESVLRRFLDWRLKYDDDLTAGRIDWPNAAPFAPRQIDDARTPALIPS
jgi:hypothetical protein